MRNNLSVADIEWIFHSWLPSNKKQKKDIIESLLFLKSIFREEGNFNNSPSDSTRFFREGILDPETVAVLYMINKLEEAGVSRDALDFHQVLEDYVSLFQNFSYFCRMRKLGKDNYSDILSRIDGRLMNHFQDYLEGINNYSNKEITFFLSLIKDKCEELIRRYGKEMIGINTTSTLMEFSSVLETRLHEREIAIILLNALDKKKEHLSSFQVGREFDYSIQGSINNNFLKLDIVLNISSKIKKLSIHVKVVIEKKNPAIIFIGNHEYFDFLHNYLLDNRHEMLETILSIMYIVTPSESIFYLPMSEQAKKILYDNRNDDDSLVFLKKIAQSSGFPAKKHKFVKTKEGYFLRCEKKSTFMQG